MVGRRRAGGSGVALSGAAGGAASVARYDGAAEQWATGATLVYAPLATQLVQRAPHPLNGRRVLDVGAGTGVGSQALQEAGAHPIALDLSHDMLAWQRRQRPPALVASVLAVPVRTDSMDDLFASFVLNHLSDPVTAMRELARPVRPDGAFLATTYSNESRSAARDLIDEVARAWGWQVPDWYLEMKQSMVPLLGSRDSMAQAARDAGLADVEVDEVAVDVGVHRADQLVDYRFGQAHIAEHLATLDTADRAALRTAAIDAVAPIMEPYLPLVVFLRAVVAAG